MTPSKLIPWGWPRARCSAKHFPRNRGGSADKGTWGRGTLARMTQLTVETEREDDGRWIAEVVELPGCMTYGSTETAAITAAQTLALRILADRVEHGDLDGASLSTVRFDRREPVAF